jgi:hypothetical protein
MKMRRVLLPVAALLVFANAEPARAGELELRAGAFAPRADTGAVNDLFRDDAQLYTVSKGDWTSFSGGVQYNFKVARNVLFGVSVDGYDRTLQTSYRDYQRPDGRNIYQTLHFEVVPMAVELRFQPTSRRTKVAPFVGVGGDLFYWKYEEYGDFVKFNDPNLPVISDSFFSEGWNGGVHVTGGVRFAVSDDVGIFGQFKYQWGKADMGYDFRGNKIDLSGASYLGGVSIRF